MSFNKLLEEYDLILNVFAEKSLVIEKDMDHRLHRLGFYRAARHLLESHSLVFTLYLVIMHHLRSCF